MRITMQCKADDYYYSRCCFSYLQFAGKKVQWQQSEWIKSEKSLSSCHHKLREKFRDLRRYRVFQQVSRIYFLSFVTFWDLFVSKTCWETTPQNTIKAKRGFIVIIDNGKFGEILYLECFVLRLLNFPNKENNVRYISILGVRQRDEGWEERNYALCKVSKSSLVR